ncbi:MAG TPA: ABC transporter permease, partial [Vicinamibacterales bacterium]|nr:ABC transporter permease [Vicinamibacterales bacterium]
MTPVWKELRTFAWPAAGIIALVVLPMVWASMFEPASAPHHLRSVLVHAFQVSAAGFLLGSALLAALPFGSEFQHRTMVQLLAQPVSRASLWLSKHGPLALVLTVIGVAAYAAVGARAVRDGFPVAQASFLLVMFCSAGLWTLVAGSTIGGAVFSLAGLAIVEMGATFVTSRVTGLELDPFDAHPALVTVRLMYAAGTLWLGWRMFARYEVKAIGEGGAPIASGVFERLAVLRSRPAGAIANLVRKEMRLQQPTFLIAALFAAVWLAAML